MLDIKPCPFCNCTNPYVDYHFYRDNNGHSYEESWVTCPLCDAQGPKEALPYDMSLMDAAIQSWNERVTNDRN